ncbi:MAG: ABC transporter ATP-binding protein, partial [Patescibacteria group bacterium]|nr:ABC transporter ATP-binding protein [Patescibacteria group bacterium]
RVALARLCLSEANLLVLDEPTNHLDLWARDALEQALLRFDGTVLFVSHDRYFLNRVADHLLVVEPDRVHAVEGNYETYQRMNAGQATMSSTAASAKSLLQSPAKSSGTAEASKRSSSETGAAGEKRRRRFPYRKVTDLEAEILECETDVEQLHAELANGATHRNGELVRKLMTQIDQRKAALALLYEHWEEAIELNW